MGVGLVLSGGEDPNISDSSNVCDQVVASKDYDLPKGSEKTFSRKGEFKTEFSYEAEDGEVYNHEVVGRVEFIRASNRERKVDGDIVKTSYFGSSRDTLEDRETNGGLGVRPGVGVVEMFVDMEDGTKCIRVWFADAKDGVTAREDGRLPQDVALEIGYVSESSRTGEGQLPKDSSEMSKLWDKIYASRDSEGIHTAILYDEFQPDSSHVEWLSGQISQGFDRIVESLSWKVFPGLDRRLGEGVLAKRLEQMTKSKS